MRTDKELEGVTLLGAGATQYPTDYSASLLEWFPNKHPENDYLVSLDCPEFIGIRTYGYAATWSEQPDNFNITGLHQSDQIFHDDVDAVFMEITVIAETEQIQFQTFAFHHFLARNIIYDDMPEIRLTGLGTQ